MDRVFASPSLKSNKMDKVIHVSKDNLSYKFPLLKTIVMCILGNSFAIARSVLAIVFRAINE